MAGSGHPEPAFLFTLMAQILRFLIVSSLAAGSKAFGPRRNNITQRDDVHGCRTFVCEGGAAEFNGYMKTDIPRSEGRLWGMVEVYDTETKERRAVKEGEVFTLSATAEAAPVIEAEGTSAPVHPVTASGPVEANPLLQPVANGGNLTGDAGEIEAGSSEQGAESQAPETEGAPTLLERIEAAVAAKAKPYAALAEELGVEVADVKEAVKGQEHLQTTGGWVKIKE